MQINSNYAMNFHMGESYKYYFVMVICSFVPVSYTHIDVYKRQQLYAPAPALTQFKLLLINSEKAGQETIQNSSSSMHLMQIESTQGMGF